jgi:hypothetical protein
MCHDRTARSSPKKLPKLLAIYNYCPAADSISILLPVRQRMLDEQICSKVVSVCLPRGLRLSNIPVAVVYGVFLSEQFLLHCLTSEVSPDSISVFLSL